MSGDSYLHSFRLHKEFDKYCESEDWKLARLVYLVESLGMKNK
jgi:hypothetical protein